MVIQALRYTFSDTSDSFNTSLGPSVIDMFLIMLNDTDLANYRLALSTLNSAVHNKPLLILPHLDSLLPSVMDASRTKPHLIREVQMGPFKHKVDDGLEIRKVSQLEEAPKNPNQPFTAPPILNDFVPN